MVWVTGVFSVQAQDLNDVLHDMLMELSKIRVKVHGNDEQQKCVNDWNRVCYRLDIFNCILFELLNLILFAAWFAWKAQLN